MRIKIFNDLYDIAAGIKDIDPRYDTVFNTENQKFEVEAEGKTVLVLPYENLDQRALERVRYTRIENMERVLEDIEKSNEELERNIEKKRRDDVENELSRIFRLRKI